MTSSSGAAVDRQPAVRARRDEAQHVARTASRRRARRAVRAAPSAAWRSAARGAARGAAAPAPAARAGRRRGSPRSAARSPRASGRAGGRSRRRRAAAAAARRCRSASAIDGREQPQRPLHRQHGGQRRLVGSCSATDFGTSSPRIIASIVSTSSTITAAVESAVSCVQPGHALEQRRQPRARCGSARRRRESGSTA